MLAYIDQGQGPTVLFSHGTPTSSYEWRHLVRALAPTHRVIAPDHLGFGSSPQPRGADYSPEAHAQRFAGFAEGLGLRDVTLVVHDFGGPIALPWALGGAGRVARLVVINSWMWPFDDDPLMRRRARLAGGRFGRFLYKWMNASLRMLMPSVYGDRKKLTREIHAHYLAPFRERWKRVEILWALARSLLGSSAHFADLWNRRAALAELPSLILWGMKDGAFRPPLIERWREVLPRARVVELAGAGHWPHEEEPDAISEHLLALG
jgi:haloalkane dehalogenase